jgi:hypothetical protein
MLKGQKKGAARPKEAARIPAAKARPKAWPRIWR